VDPIITLDDDPGSALGAWALLVSQEWLVLFAWPLALAYVYPDGRLPSPRWKPMAVVALASPRRCQRGGAAAFIDKPSIPTGRPASSLTTAHRV